MEDLPLVKPKDEGEWLDVLGMRIKFLCTGEDSGGRYSSMLNTVPKGRGAPPHSHPWDETFYILSGRVKFVIAEGAHVLGPGDYARVPANTVHAFEGLSEEEGLMLLNESPSHSQSFFREIHDRVRNLPEDLEYMPEIGERHQVRFV